ncbi:MAG TPA: hypothetical protein VK151_07940 [Fluviicola sp.]|nr:hypothetical protein [Fluviicola sp.]
MKEHNNDTELQQLLREKLEGHTVPAPDFVWPAIEQELFPRAKKRRSFFWWFIFAGLFLGTLSWFFLFPSKSTDFSFGTAAAPVSKTVQSLQPIPTAATEKQSQSTDKSTVTKSKSSGTTAMHSNEPGTNTSEKHNGPFVSSSQPGKDPTTVANKSVPGKGAKRPSPSKSPSNPPTKPVTYTIAHSSSVTASLIAKTAGYFATINTIAETRQPDSNDVSAMSALSSKTIAFQPDTVKLIHPFIPLSIGFSGYSFIDVYLGVGRNRRTYSGIVESNSNAFIIDRTLQLKNTHFGIDYNYQFLPFASAGIGLNMGSNRYITRLFPIRIANTDLNKELEISSPGGDLKSAPLELEDQASSISDTTTFLMRIIHRSKYLAIPLTIRFNTTNARGPQLYGFTGFDFVFRGKDQNTLIVRRSLFERSYSTSNPRGARGFYSGWHLGLGLASNPSRRLQLYGEFNYSQVFGNYYSGKVISIKSSHLQLNAGLRINLY